MRKILAISLCFLLLGGIILGTKVASTAQSLSSCVANQIDGNGTCIEVPASNCINWASCKDGSGRTGACKFVTNTSQPGAPIVNTCTCVVPLSPPGLSP